MVNKASVNTGAKINESNDANSKSQEKSKLLNTN